MFFKVSEATAARRRVPIHCADATDGITPETGEASGQPQVSKNGGAWANTTATLTSIGNGAYYVELTATELNTIGLVQVRYKSAATAEYQIDGFIFSYDPYDAVALGLTNLDATVSSRLSTAGYTTPPTAAAIGTQVWATASRDLSTSPPTAAAIGTQVWATAARDLTTSPPTAAAITTAVWAAGTRTLTTTIPTAAAISTAVWGETVRTLTATLDPTAAAIADQVWDEVLSGHLTALTTGAALNGAGAAGDPWTTALPGAYGAGTAGNIIGNRIDAAITSRMATFTYTAPPTAAAVSTQVWAETVRALTSSLDPSAATIGTAVWAVATRALTDKANFTLTVTPPTAAAISTAVWAETTRSLTTFGTLVADVATAVWAAVSRTLTSGGGISAADVWAYVTRTLTGGGTAPTAAEVADAVWDEALAGHLVAATTGNKLNSLTGAGGVGGLTYTYTVTNSLTGLPIDDVQVWLSTDIAGLNVVASTRTNASGQAIFTLDAGSYFVWRSKSGINFVNPDLEIVS